MQTVWNSQNSMEIRKVPKTKFYSQSTDESEIKKGLSTHSDFVKATQGLQLNKSCLKKSSSRY